MKNDTTPLCACGCGTLVKKCHTHRKLWRRFAWGHNSKTAAGRKQMRARTHGRRHTKATRAKMAVSHKGHPVSEETKAKIVAERRKNGSYVVSEPVKQRIADHVRSLWKDPVYRASLSGENGSNWHGGIAKIRYTSKFQTLLRFVALQRDSFSCQNPECQHLGDMDLHLEVHHVDFDKRNDVLDNLVTLCRACHRATCVGSRSEWSVYYRNVMVPIMEGTCL